jgi:hypothetical protein
MKRVIVGRGREKESQGSGQRLICVLLLTRLWLRRAILSGLHVAVDGRTARFVSERESTS